MSETNKKFDDIFVGEFKTYLDAKLEKLVAKALAKGESTLVDTLEDRLSCTLDNMVESAVGDCLDNMSLEDHFDVHCAVEDAVQDIDFNDYVEVDDAVEQFLNDIRLEDYVDIDVSVDNFIQNQVKDPTKELKTALLKLANSL